LDYCGAEGGFAIVATLRDMQRYAIQMSLRRQDIHLQRQNPRDSAPEFLAKLEAQSSCVPARFQSCLSNAELCNPAPKNNGKAIRPTSVLQKRPLSRHRGPPSQEQPGIVVSQQHVPRAPAGRNAFDVGLLAD